MEPQLRLLSVGEILGQAFELAKKNFAALISVILRVLLPVYLLNFALIIFFFRSVVRGSGVSAVVGLSIAYALMTVAINIIANQLANAAALRIHLETRAGRSASASESMGFAMSRVGPLVSIAFLSGILIMLGLLAFIIPGIYLGIVWSIAVPVLLLENQTGFAALNRSRDLVRGRAGMVFGALFVGGLVAGIIGAIVSRIVTGPIGNGSIGAVAFASTLSSLISAVISLPYVSAITALLYLSLRADKEQFTVDELRSELDAGS